MEIFASPQVPLIKRKVGPMGQFQYSWRIILGGMALTTILSGCLQDQVKEGDTTADVVPIPDPSSFVCNPLDAGSDNLGAEQGLHAELFAADPNGPHYNTAMEYMSNATKVPVDVYFNQLFVPTRPFDRGFVTRSGNVIQTADGTTLYEWFGMRFKSELQLAADDVAGDYQVAILSDDGSVMTVGSGASQSVLVDNDGWHPTQMGCATIPIHLNQGEVLPFQLDYFQGPRYHISLVMMWRPWPTRAQDVMDPLCGRNGNSMYFNYQTDPPTPTANYNALLARGWRVVTPEHFLLPRPETSNPCNEPAPVMSQVSVINVATNSATVSWLTDRAASSQVEYVDVAGNITLRTTLDSTMNVGHSVQLTGLTANTQYNVKAISASISGRSSESAIVTFRTRR